MSTSAVTEPEPPLWRRFVRELNHGSLGWAIGLALTVALVLNPIFITPFPALLGRTLFVALAVVLAYHLAGLWRAPIVPRWLAQALAVVIVAPTATFGAYLLATSGDTKAILDNPYRMLGFLWIAGCAMVLGVLVALGAVVREREAQAQSLALQFELERGRLERQALDARLELLRAQIEPHFLFNTLANVQALAESGSPRAAPVLGSLIAYLRATLPRLKDGAQATLADELDLVRAYLELMHLRMPDRLDYRVDVDRSVLDQRFPPMALLTLVENAIRHGVDPSEQGGRVEVGGLREADGRAVRLWVSDTGVGLRGSAASGTGLANLRERLRGTFGPSAALTLQPREPHGLRAEIRFDART
jgi:signal transduction histidine kinase